MRAHIQYQRKMSPLTMLKGVFAAAGVFTAQTSCLANRRASVMSTAASYWAAEPG